MSGKEYKYFIFSNAQEWCISSWSGVSSLENVCFFKSMIPGYGKTMSFLWLASIKLKLRFFRRLLYPFICNRISCESEDIPVFVFYDWNVLTYDTKFIVYLKNKFQNSTFVYLFSNVVKITGANHFGILDSLKSTYDLVCAFDEMDAKTYGFHYWPLIYTANPCYNWNAEDKYDLFYIGNAKDRLNALLDIYSKAIESNLKCKFFIVGVPEEEQKFKDGIIYNTRLSYEECLKYISESRCLVDAIQKESTGLTIKTCEAVIYNKKLLTTNLNISDSSVYSAENVYLYGEDDRDLSDFIHDEITGYSAAAKAYFSPYRLFEYINKLQK